MALVRNVVIVTVAIAFYNRICRQHGSEKDKLLERYDYVIGKGRYLYLKFKRIKFYYATLFM